ncbi:hypothetical protein [Natrarchaeobius oligotrophus]|uniref:Glutamate-rich protein n=1 Tax=Natrarchaeobius chitinivorans TaxID=1679083 RepID=A0A3N6PHC2_NATCH|nr:hypothetical protein [Natrarchaeobius chitinivorans]RQG97395.1 hypothetical protein EA472_19385 [Natrarchaeobius chitinivorans]
MNPRRVDAIIDLAYGGLILVSIVLIATLDLRIGLTFALGVFASYVLHVVWKMARFDPEWMTSVVRETVEESVQETVGEAVEESVEEAVGETVERTIEETVGEQIDEVQAKVESVDDRVDRRPHEEQIEESVDGTGETD